MDHARVRLHRERLLAQSIYKKRQRFCVDGATLRRVPRSAVVRGPCLRASRYIGLVLAPYVR